MDATRKHSEYKGNVIERYKQEKDEEVQMTQDIEECQGDLLEKERKRIEEENAESGIGIDELMQNYAKDDLYHEYLVDGAVLRCTQATISDFRVSDEVVVRLNLDAETEGEAGDRERTTLHVCESSMLINDDSYATVGDAVKYQNVVPFKCNCKVPVDREEERERIAADASCSEFGVCRHLMELNARWENAFMEGTEYLTKNRPIGVGGVAALWNEDPMTIEEEGITMTSVLFCRHGGIIYPINSGQVWIKEVINVKKEIMALLDEPDDDIRIEKVKEYIIKMKEENPDYAKFLEILYGSESQGTGGYGAVSGTHLGRYQLGDDALEQIEFKKDGKWTKLAQSLGVHTKDDFLKNETAQEVAVLFYTRWGYQYIITYGDIERVGTTVEEQVKGKHYKVEVTVSGLIAAGHLIGAGDLNKAFLGVIPWEKALDGNGTSALKYMEEMGGFDLTGILGGIE